MDPLVGADVLEIVDDVPTDTISVAIQTNRRLGLRSKQPCLFPHPAAAAATAVGLLRPNPNYLSGKMADLSKITFSISISLWPKNRSGPNSELRSDPIASRRIASDVRRIMDFQDSDRNGLESRNLFGANKLIDLQDSAKLVSGHIVEMMTRSNSYETFTPRNSSHLRSKNKE